LTPNNKNPHDAAAAAAEPQERLPTQLQENIEELEQTGLLT
jgi:hypothetical protein